MLNMRSFLLALCAYTSFTGLHALEPLHPAAPLPVTKAFTYPGIVRYTGGSYEGGDHLLGVGRNVTVEVELEIYGEAGQLALTRSDLLLPIQDLFREYRFSIEQAPPYLPLFDLVVIVLPINKGYCVYISGRLFEKVELRNLQFDSSITWQAITWEKESFQVIPEEHAAKEIQENALIIAKNFIDRVAFFESIPQQQIPYKSSTVTPSGSPKIQIKETVPKIGPYKPLPEDPKAKREALLEMLKNSKK